MSSFIIGIGNCFESFLACSIPDLVYQKSITCNLTVFPFKSNVLILKSTPIVGRKLSLKTLSAKRRRREDLPTAELPIKRILKRKSYSYCMLIILNIINTE